MKKCYYFPTWKEQKDVMISLDEKTILFVNAVKTNLYALTQIIEHNQDSLIIAKKIARDGLETMIIEQSTPSDPILAKLCELTGAKMYGDYMILDEELMGWIDYTVGDVLTSNLVDDNYDKIADIKLLNQVRHESTGYYSSIFLETPTNDGYKLNIFQEYSKFLRNEESKWEEVKKIVL